VCVVVGNAVCIRKEVFGAAAILPKIYTKKIKKSPMGIIVFF
jgi:hypothetical protein